MIILLNSCTAGNVPIPKTGNKTLDSLLASAPATIINLKNRPVDTLYATKQNRFATKIVDSLHTLASFGRVVGMVKMGNYLYVADAKRHCIWAVNNNGVIIQKIGREGRGPGEFLNLTGMTKNSKHVFTTDNSNARLIRFDDHFNPSGLLRKVTYGGNILTGNQSIAATDSLLYLPLKPYFHKKLIEVYQSAPPFDSLGAFLPRLTPPGMLPVYNSYVIACSSRGSIAISYIGLPYIFLYDKNHQLEHILYLKFPKNESPDNPSPKPVHNNSPMKMGISRLIINLAFTAGDNLYLFDGRKLYKIRSDITADKYRFRKAWFFTDRNHQKGKDVPYPLPITTLAISSDTVYLGSVMKEYVYRFSLNE